jgi:hypothetical protein
VRQLQKAFDNGHQPWRGDPIWVAAVAIIEALADESPREAPPTDLTAKLAVEGEAASESIVRGKGALYEYTVYLTRLLGPHGIWTAIRVAMAPLDR